MKLGSRIYQARLHANLTQQEAADIFGVSPPMVSQYENDHAKPGLKKLEKFGIETGLGTAWFFLKEGETILGPDQQKAPQDEALEALEATWRDFERIELSLARAKESLSQIREALIPASQAVAGGAPPSQSQDKQTPPAQGAASGEKRKRLKPGQTSGRKRADRPRSRGSEGEAATS